MNKITVYTPAFNRSKLLKRCYKGLINQSCQDFDWLIIDDGSTDDTSELVSEWIKEKKINIRYIKQENQGMHGAHNTAHKNINTELCVCCDSDDYLTKNAISSILNLWSKEGNEKFAGLIGHDCNLNGEILNKLPNELTETTLYDLRYRKKLHGDFKLVYRSEILKKEPYPIFPNEKYLAVGYKYFMIDQEYKLLVTQDIICAVDYQEDGETNNKFKKYITSPNGFMHYRTKMIPIMHNFPTRFWQAVHLSSSAIFAKRWFYFMGTTSKLTVLVAMPFGVLLNLYIRLKSYTKEKSKKRSASF